MHKTPIKSKHLTNLYRHIPVCVYIPYACKMQIFTSNRNGVKSLMNSFVNL